MNKKHLIVASSVVAVSWVSSGVYVFLGLRKIRQESAKDEAAGIQARDILLEKIRRGEYHGKSAEDIYRDYHFFKIAERLDD